MLKRENYTSEYILIPYCDFLNHLVAQNTVFVQAEKDISIFIFRFLQELGYEHLLYKPNKADYALYWEKDGIVVRI